MTEIMDSMNLSDKRLSKGQKKIAEYVTAHEDKAAFMTARALSEKAGVNESTVIRFASALGYTGYPHFQQALQEHLRRRLTANERVEMTGEMTPADAPAQVIRRDIANLRNTLEQLDLDRFSEVVQRLLSAESIYVMGLRSAAPLAQFMAYYLNHIFPSVRQVSAGSADVFEEIIKLRRQDVLVCISFPRYSSRTLEAMRFARRCGAQVIAITDSPSSPLCAIADVSLTAGTDMASFVDSMAAPMSLINALLVTLGLHRKEALSDHFRQLQDIWDTYQVYSEDGKNA